MDAHTEAQRYKFDANRHLTGVFMLVLKPISLNNYNFLSVIIAMELLFVSKAIIILFYGRQSFYEQLKKFYIKNST